MSRVFFLNLFLVFFLFSGCDSPGPVSDGGIGRLDSPEGMKSYLEGQRLPGLESVEVWSNEYGAGLKLVTEHYEVFTTLLEPLMLRDLPGFLESAHRAYNRQLGGVSVSTETRFVVYLFSERAQWEDFTRKFAGVQAEVFLKIKAGAYALKGVCVAYNIGRERTFSILGHEGWHQFNKKHFKYRLPSWLDEGIAMQFEVSRYERGRFYFEPSWNGYRLGSLKQTLSNGHMLPLSILLGMNPGEVLVTDSDAYVGAFYSQSYALVRFLREADYSKRLGAFHQLLMGGVEGTWPISEQSRRIAMDRNIPLTVLWNKVVGRELFSTYIGEDIEQIEQEYLSFCRKIVYRVRLKSGGG